MWNVPLQLRKQFSAPERRFQVGGFLETSLCSVKREAFMSAATGYDYPTRKAVNYFIGAGLSSSYAVGKRLDVNTDLLLNSNV